MHSLSSEEATWELLLAQTTDDIFHLMELSVAAFIGLVCCLGAYMLHHNMDISECLDLMGFQEEVKTTEELNPTTIYKVWDPEEIFSTVKIKRKPKMANKKKKSWSKRSKKIAQPELEITDSGDTERILNTLDTGIERIGPEVDEEEKDESEEEENRVEEISVTCSDSIKNEPLVSSSPNHRVAIEMTLETSAPLEQRSAPPLNYPIKAVLLDESLKTEMQDSPIKPKIQKSSIKADMLDASMKSKMLDSSTPAWKPRFSLQNDKLSFFLRQLDLGEYLDYFNSVRLDLDMLRGFEDRDFDELNIPAGPRKRIQNGLTNLKYKSVKTLSRLPPGFQMQDINPIPSNNNLMNIENQEIEKNMIWIAADISQILND